MERQNLQQYKQEVEDLPLKLIEALIKVKRHDIADSEILRYFVKCFLESTEHKDIAAYYLSELYSNDNNEQEFFQTVVELLDLTTLFDPAVELMTLDKASEHYGLNTTSFEHILAICNALIFMQKHNRQETTFVKEVTEYINSGRLPKEVMFYARCYGFLKRDYDFEKHAEMFKKMFGNDDPSSLMILK